MLITKRLRWLARHDTNNGPEVAFVCDMKYTRTSTRVRASMTGIPIVVGKGALCLMTSSQLDRFCLQDTGAPETSLLGTRFQASGRLPWKTIYDGIRTCTRRQAQLEIRFRDKGQSSVESARLRRISGAYASSQLETGGYTSWQGHGTSRHRFPETT